MVRCISKNNCMHNYVIQVSVLISTENLVYLTLLLRKSQELLKQAD